MDFVEGIVVVVLFGGWWCSVGRVGVCLVVVFVNVWGLGFLF